jgi:hypothetical protein
MTPVIVVLQILQIPLAQNKHKDDKADDRSREAVPSRPELLLEHPQNTEAKQAEY